MDWKAKTGIVGAVLLIIAVLVFIVKVQYDTIQRLKAIETSVVESKDIGNGIVRAQSSYVTREDLERMLRDQNMSLSDIKKDLSKLGVDVRGVQTIAVVTPGYRGTGIPSTTVVHIDPPNNPDLNQLVDRYGYLTTQQWLNLTEPFDGGMNVPFGRAGFSASMEKPWSVEVLPRRYGSTTVLGQDEDGRHYAYSRFQIEVDGKTYTVPVTESKLVEEYPTPSFSFNPRVYLGIDAGAIANPPASSELTPNAGLSLFSYGRIKVSPDFSFLTLGVGYATQRQAPVLILSPINYNVGKPIPLIDNLYVGPSVSVDVDGNIGLYVGARVGL